MDGNSDALTRTYLDRYAVEWRHLNAAEATTECTLLGRRLSTPILAGGMAHYEGANAGGAPLFAGAVAAAGSVMWTGFCPDEDMDKILAAGAPAVRIIKPFADRELVRSAIAHDAAAGAMAFSMDIDHVFDQKGRIYKFFDQPLAPQTQETLAAYAALTDLPFLPKGVLSVQDALLCQKAGAAGVVISHHQNMFPWSVPPLCVLPEIRRAVGKDFLLIVDCGIETGYDAFKALALGADAVCVARPLRREFSDGGAEAVRARLVRMTDELRVCLSRTGAPDIRRIDPAVLRVL